MLSNGAVLCVAAALAALHLDTAAAGPCDGSALAASLLSIKTECCSIAGSCDAAGHPNADADCDSACAAVAMPFWEECGTTLAATAGMANMDAFTVTCAELPTCDVGKLSSNLQAVKELCCVEPTTAMTSHWVVVGNIEDYMTHETGDKVNTCMQDHKKSSPAKNQFGNKHGVTCCDSETGTAGSRPDCLSEVGFEAAEDHCALSGQVLCSVAQIEAGAGVGTGCRFDGYHVWTRDTCGITTGAETANKCAAHGYPTKGDNCTKSCGAVFEPFWDSCGIMLHNMGMSGMAQMKEFYPKCLATMYPPGMCGDTCNAKTLQCRMQEVQQACCTEGNNCPNSRPVPLTCPVECALVYPNFVNDCKAVFPAALKSELPRLTTFSKRCLKTDIVEMVEYAAVLQSRGCAVNLATPTGAPTQTPTAAATDAPTAAITAAPTTAAITAAPTLSAAPVTTNATTAAVTNATTAAPTTAATAAAGGVNRRRLGMHVSGQLSALAVNSTELCPFDQFDDQLSEVDMACCSPGVNCTSTCSPFCAVAFHDFFKSCSSQISMMGKAAQFVAFDTLCTSSATVSDPAAFLAALDKAQCNSCTDKIKNGDEEEVDCGGSCTACGGSGAYIQIRFNVLELRSDSANSVQMAELKLYGADGVQLTGGAASNPGGSNPGQEMPGNAYDDDTSTKWLDFNKGNLLIDFAAPVRVTKYDWATANDATERDPVRWKLEGSNTGEEWMVLDQDYGDADFATDIAREEFQGPFVTV